MPLMALTVADCVAWRRSSPSSSPRRSRPRRPARRRRMAPGRGGRGRVRSRRRPLLFRTPSASTPRAAATPRSSCARSPRCTRRSSTSSRRRTAPTSRGRSASAEVTDAEVAGGIASARPTATRLRRSSRDSTRLRRRRGLAAPTYEEAADDRCARASRASRTRSTCSAGLPRCRAHCRARPARPVQPSATRRPSFLAPGRFLRPRPGVGAETGVEPRASPVPPLFSRSSPDHVRAGATRIAGTSAPLPAPKKLHGSSCARTSLRSTRSRTPSSSAWLPVAARSATSSRSHLEDVRDRRAADLARRPRPRGLARRSAPWMTGTPTAVRPRARLPDGGARGAHRSASTCAGRACPRSSTHGSGHRPVAGRRATAYQVWYPTPARSSRRRRP